MRVFLFLMFLLPLALAQEAGTETDFSALSVRPDGPETFDLATGITTLPQGGEVSYREAGVTLAGDFIRYKEGDFIEVRGATVRGAFGLLEALELRFEVASQRLQASSGARFQNGQFAVRAERLALELASNTAVAEGVTSETPGVESRRALIDARGRQALLVGPYTYRDGPVTLRGEADDLLALRWDEAGGVSARTEVPSALRERFGAFLR